MIELQNKHLQQIIEKLVESFQHNTPLSAEFYEELQKHPQYGLELLSLLPTLQQAAENEEESSPLLMACYHYIEMCLVQLKLAEEHFQKWAEQLIDQYQKALLKLMSTTTDSSCWLPIINLFFDAEIPLNDDVKQMYLSVMEQSQKQQNNKAQQQILVEQLLSNESDASEFEIAELFLAQTNALPADYFPSFLKELLSFKLNKATNTAILFLLHPLAEVRNTIIQHANEIFAHINLPQSSMSRLLMIRHWLPEIERNPIELLLNNQRRQGQSFAKLGNAKIIELFATEMDGTGAQAMFLLIKRHDGYQAAGLLIKRYYGIKDTWLSPVLSKTEAKRYSQKNLQGGFYLRKINLDYLNLIISDHIYQAQKIDSVPHLNLLQLQELTGAQWQAQPLNIDLIYQQLLKQLPELNQQYQQKSLLRSAQWYKKYAFTESWFDESPELDKLVNQYCSFIDGVKHCNISKAVPVIMTQYFEPRREQWLDHFLWMSLWAKAHSRHNEYLWKDSFVIAQALYQNKPMLELPILQIICEHSILQSVETMENRKTHLS